MRSLMDKNLLERLSSVDNLSKLIYRALSLDTDKHQIWAIRNRRALTIMTDNSILATQLHYQRQRVLDYINSNSSLLLDSVTVKMTTPSSHSNRKVHPGYKISDRNSKILLSVADSIEDEELKEGLKKIARLGQHSPQTGGK